ncbi:nSTAND3 domain-containing NTPase [Streptomyces mexicanus]|uniref:nSTAND3 domain-containing NTPase n=1 Tax=Streptomyces mexicanus TaxID=178566 RepID=UPI00368CBADC
MNTFRYRFGDAGRSAYNTGPGPQYVYQYFGNGPEDRESRSRPLATDLLAGLRRRFEPPVGFGEARRILAESHTVLIDGEPGSGRSAAARMLLFEYRTLRSNLREALAEDDEGNVRLETRPLPESVGLLLDLSDADLPTWRTVHDGLPGFHDSVRRSGSRLAVVLPVRLPLSALHSDLAPLRAVIHRPDARLVLQSALREAGLEDFRDLPEDIDRYLKHEPALGEVTRLAWLVRAEAGAGRRENFADWCRAAVEALTRRPQEVARHVVALPDGRPRALLLTTAMLHGARSDAVYEACETLLGCVDHPLDDRPLLDREDLSARFAEIRAAPDQHGRVTFTEINYDIAVRTHFWNNMPGLRARLGDWAGKAVALRSLMPEDRRLLAERFAEQVLRTGTVEDFLQRVRTWADHADRHVRKAAAHALTYGSLHPDHGRAVRKELYSWATSSSLTAALTEVLTDVCSGELASRHPEQAMVRLHHVARRTRFGQEAEKSLIGLALGDHLLHHRMLERLARGLADSRDADIRLFAALASPQRLTASHTASRARTLLDERGVGSSLAGCWSGLFGNVPGARWHGLLHQWLSAADQAAPDRRAQLLDILVHACRQQLLPLALLYRLALPHRVAPLVQQKIDAVQGRLRTSP